MEFQEMLVQLHNLLKNEQLISATISQPRQKSNDLKRIKLKPIAIKNAYHIQIEYQFEQVLKHENIQIEEIEGKILSLFDDFRQFQGEFKEESVQIQLSKKNKVLYKSQKNAIQKEVDLSHNRKKQYLLDPEVAHPFLIRLGVQTADGKVKKQKYDKFKQINRFIEFIDDALVHLPQDRTIRILDFGSGKSYLTFALYYYLKVIKNMDIRVTGLDLKKDVIAHCAEIAKDLQYDDLEFLVGDINDYNDESAVDMVVTLHACDVATDMALSRAVKWQAKVILSVPCCQHELNQQLASSPLDIMLQHGLVKDRFAALATDSIRAEILQLVGYDAQLLEFIDMENTPKNILIRAYQSKKTASTEQIARYHAFTQFLNATPFLEKELKEYMPK